MTPLAFHGRARGVLGAFGSFQGKQRTRAVRYLSITPSLREHQHVGPRLPDVLWASRIADRILSIMVFDIPVPRLLGAIK